MNIGEPPSNTIDIPRAPEDRRALVAIDLGAESCRVSLLRWIQQAPRIQLVHRFPNAAVEQAGSLRWDFEYIFAELEHGLRCCAAIATEGIRSIAVDGWAVDYIRLDPAGKAIANPFCYRDQRTVEVMVALHERISAKRMRELTGIQQLRINTAYQMFADDAQLRQLPWLNLPEYILYRLGGCAVSERTNASHTQMLGLDGQWSHEIFRALECDLSTAPKIVEPGTDLGQLTGDLASLSAYANTRLIAPACHDTASAIAAIPDAGDDWAYISSGTWSLVGTVLDAPLQSPEAGMQNFSNLAGADGTICFHKNVNGMWLVRQCIESWKSTGAKLTLSALIEDASKFPPRDYVLDVDDPDLLMSGEMLQRINALLQRRGLTTFSVEPVDAAELASFLFISLASRYAEVLRKVALFTAKRLHRIYIMGGGSQNELLNRLTMEATGLEVCRAGVECSTAGNFAVQLATLERKQSARPATHTTSSWAALLAPT